MYVYTHTHVPHLRSKGTRPRARGMMGAVMKEGDGRHRCLRIPPGREAGGPT